VIVEEWEGPGEEEDESEEEEAVPPGKQVTRKSGSRFTAFTEGLRLSSASRAESMFLLSAWMVYFIYNVNAYGKGATWS